MDREALCHFQRQGVDLGSVFFRQGRCLAPEPQKLAPADVLELLV
jgi:hypothetical protein